MVIKVESDISASKIILTKGKDWVEGLLASIVWSFRQHCK
jgi:hypothetical protein